METHIQSPEETEDSVLLARLKRPFEFKHRIVKQNLVLMRSVAKTGEVRGCEAKEM